ncbi:11881_t:CDS:1 [Acaulospora morrowiae]|uniref:11881_t:CDS:1 n=1 Tax=Acaulospora morrowiae TaxID=94023 RepID=A0A9N9FP10_9GLOM|nr:11881_t:CDS:1 [Acaulospora morrowiae]
MKDPIYPKLSFDCLNEIFKHLKNERVTLYSCLFANSGLCKISVSLLWFHPFEYLLKDNQYHALIRTLYCCLSESDKQEAHSKGISLPSNLITPLFDYARFIRGLDTKNFHLAQMAWKRRSNSTMTMDQINYVIGNLILQRSDSLRILVIDHKLGFSMNERHCTPYIFFFRVKNAFSNIQELTIRFHRESTLVSTSAYTIRNLSSLINIISSQAQSIKKLSAYMDFCFIKESSLTEFNDNLLGLISKQRNLIHLSLLGEHCFAFFCLMTKRTSIQPNVFKHLSISNIEDTRTFLHGLSTCQNLETLDIHDKLPSEIPYSSMVSENFPSIHIKHLNLFLAFNFKTLTKMLLRLSGHRLISIRLRYTNSEIIDYIRDYSNQLKFLSIGFSSDEAISISNMLPKLRSLDHLDLVYFNFPREIRDSSIEGMEKSGLEILANSFPSNLNILGLDMIFPTNKMILDTILENVQIPLKKLNIYNTMTVEISHTIINYVERIGGLKKLGINDKKFKEKWGGHRLIESVSEADHIIHFL